MGTGFVSRLHLEGLSRLGAAVEVCALATADLEHGRKLGGEFGIDKIASDYRALLDDAVLDAMHGSPVYNPWSAVCPGTNT